ncbi:uncharacterized protein LOC141589728 [Silene latifolia]|uniref:uncharacterized protein LOC141589728 n=1 Tax=Silene latifolia TaxID=37657 RepID=UPI003D779027
MDNLGCWNVRGINNINKQSDIKWFLHQNKIGLYGLVETKVKSHNFNFVLNNIGNRWYGINNNVHHPGGRIWIIWLPQIFNVQMVSASDQQITVAVEDLNTGEKFWFTVVYGSNSDSDRIHLWHDLTTIKDSYSGPWCESGDFNNILHFNERLGGTVIWGELEEFGQCLQYCELVDIQAQGSFYTWNNKQGANTRVYSRIDRFLINHEWLSLYPNSYAYFLNEGLFDHYPCICYRRLDRTIRKSHFRYFNMWGQTSDFLAIVGNEWEKPILGCKMFQVVCKLKWLKKPLKQLNRAKFSDIEKAADLARLLLDNIQTKLTSNTSGSGSISC